MGEAQSRGARPRGAREGPGQAEAAAAAAERQQQRPPSRELREAQRRRCAGGEDATGEADDGSASTTSTSGTPTSAGAEGAGVGGAGAEGESAGDDAAVDATANVEASMSLASSSGSTRNLADADEEDLMPLPLPPPLVVEPGSGDALEGRERGVTLDENDVMTASESEDEDLDAKNAKGILAHHNDSSSETSSTGSDDLAEDPNESYRRGIGAIPSMQETPPSWANDTEGWTRTIGLGDNATMHSNAVHTTKYTAMSFLPRSFLLQYRRAGNIFFTVIVVVMLLGTFSRLFDSPQAPWGNIFVLSVIFGLNMTSEFLDDRARARKDDETNAQPIKILDPVDRKFVTKTWREVRRGDLLRLEKNSVCPADVLVLTTSDIDTELCCYVQTANIDGETYLKKRHCKKEVVDNIIMSPPETADWVEGREFRYEPPSSSLSSFRIVAMPRKGERRQEPLAFTSENVVLRGAQLRNTEWIFGVVLYTGNETKTLMSIAPARIKQSKVDRMVNQVIVTVLVMLVLLLGASILLSTYAYKPTTELWYMMFTPESSGNLLPSGLALILTYLVLYRQILPILLYAVQEGLNVAQAKYIGWDLNMYDEASGKFASCNTTSLAQEIGQVKWIFSDKTGTLTRNEMRLVAICINNRVYGRATNKQLEELAREKLSPLDASRSCFTDVLDVLASSSEPGEREKLQHFFTALALCHTVLVESSSANHPVKDSTRLLRRSSLTARSGSIMHATTLESAVDADGVHVAKKKRSPNQRRLRMTLKSRKHASEVILQARQSEGFQSDFNEPSPDEADDSENHEDDGNLSDPVPTYNAESPDEEALVLGACALGFEFAYTEGESTIGLRFRSPTLDPNRTTYANEANGGPLQPDASGRNIYHFHDSASTRYQGYEVLAINPFTSDRKRMSVLYADPDNPGRRILFCKGADNQMLSAANPDTTDYDSIRANLKSFAENGLRTLIVGEREVSDDEYRSWSKLHEEACAMTGKERKARLDEVAREIEVKLSILGLTAVEDRLQDGVPQTISILRAAKINIWLITGDKVETAINIGRSAELISQNSRVLMLTAEDLGISEEQQQKPSISPAQPENKRQGSSFAVEANGLALEDIQDHIHNVIQDRLARMSSEDDGRLSRPSMSGIYAGGYQSYVMNRDNEERGISGFCMRLFSRRRGKTENVEADANLALVVDGDTLHYIMSKKHPNAELEAAFLQLARGCGVVIACRTSPGQKADLVELVKANVYPTPTTLAIGDGANDVPMIEKGHVGVGISGKEGTHAANAADFTIAQFKFLAPLLLVHGRFGYIRVAKAISLTFFANLLFTFVSFFYNFICRFSGTPAFNNAQYVIFQAFIAIPVFVIGWLDRDTKWVYDTLRNPRLYDIGRLNRILHPAIVDAQILRGLVHGAFAFLLVFHNDYEASYLALSGSLFVVITCVLTVRQASVASCYTWGLLFGVCFNIVGCLVLVSLINFFYSGSESNIFNLDKWGRYYWNQLVASVFIISLLDYLAPLTYTQMRDLINRLRFSLHKARQTVDEDPHDALFDGQLVGSPATAHSTSAAFLGPPMATELQSPSDLRPTTPRGPGLSVVSEGEAEASDLESVRSTQERDVVMRY